MKKLIILMIATLFLASCITPHSPRGHHNRGDGEGSTVSSIDGARPGYGYGDENHDHYGPPGQDKGEGNNGEGHGHGHGYGHGKK